MITHVIVKLDAPIEEKYWQDDDIFSNEYYGRGKPLIRCKECKYAYRGYNKYVCTRHFYDFSIWPDGYCSLAERKEE